MNLTKEEELSVFRGINGNARIWNNERGRLSYMNSNRISDLRSNQGKAKSKLMRSIIAEELTPEDWKKGGRGEW